MEPCLQWNLASVDFTLNDPVLSFTYVIYMLCHKSQLNLNLNMYADICFYEYLNNADMQDATWSLNEHEHLSIISLFSL